MLFLERVYFRLNFCDLRVHYRCFPVYVVGPTKFPSHDSNCCILIEFSLRLARFSQYSDAKTVANSVTTNSINRSPNCGRFMAVPQAAGCCSIHLTRPVRHFRGEIQAHDPERCERGGERWRTPNSHTHCDVRYRCRVTFGIFLVRYCTFAAKRKSFNRNNRWPDRMLVYGKCHSDRTDRRQHGRTNQQRRQRELQLRGGIVADGRKLVWRRQAKAEANRLSRQFLNRHLRKLDAAREEE